MTTGKQTTVAWILALVVLAFLGLFVTVGFAQSDEGQAAPLFQGEPQLALTLQKDSDVSVVTVGQSVVYTVIINNPGVLAETVAIVSDTLPSGFTFLMMSADSDVQAPPEGNTGTLIWTEPLTIPAGESRRLVYQVRAGATGFKVNRAGAQTVGGDPLEPASVTVRVDSMRVYLPAVLRSPPMSTLPFEDNFDQGVSSDWVVFDNYPGLSEADWGPFEDWPVYAYDPFNPDWGSGWEGYALSMYLGPGSEEWTDYEVVTTLMDRRDKLAGLWVRGSYQEMGDNQGGRVGGYYVHLKPGDDYVYLWRLPPHLQTFHQPELVKQVAYPPGIGTRRYYHLKVAVQGANIKVWVKRADYPEGAYVLLIDWTDPNSTYMKGTVGFSAFRTLVLYDDITVTELSASGQ